MIGLASQNNLLTASYSININTATSISYKANGQGSASLNQAGNDQVSLSYQVETNATYSESNSIQSLANDGYEILRSMVQKVFHEQGVETKFAAGDAEVDLETLSQEEAQELVADDGYFGVEKTSERIFQFAVGIAGNDPGRIDAIKQGVEKGFQEALDAFGGWLPDISYDTYDTVMQKLDGWVEGFDR